MSNMPGILYISYSVEMTQSALLTMDSLTNTPNTSRGVRQHKDIILKQDETIEISGRLKTMVHND